MDSLYPDLPVCSMSAWSTRCAIADTTVLMQGLTRGGVTVIKAIEFGVVIVDSPVVARVVWRVVRNEL